MGFEAAELGTREVRGKRDELPPGGRLGDLDELGASVLGGRLGDLDELGAESSGKKVYYLSNCSIHNETTYTKA